KRAEWERCWELQRCEDGNACDVRKCCRRDGEEATDDQLLSNVPVNWHEVGLIAARTDDVEDLDGQAYDDAIASVADDVRVEVLKPGAKVSDICRAVNRR